MRRVAIASLAMMMLCLSSCSTSDVTAAERDFYVVHAVLEAGQSVQYVVLQRTSGIGLQQRPVSGAIVTLTTPDGRFVQASETVDTRIISPVGPPATISYRLRLADIGATVQPGSRYRLRIQVAGSPDILGTTVVPGPPSANSIETADTLRRETDTLKVAWARVSGAARYQVSLTSLPLAYTVLSDTSTILPGKLKVMTGNYYEHVDLFVTGKTYALAVLAVDENYFRYYTPNADVLTESASAGLVNAIGVFGSVARVGNRTVVVK